MRWYTCTPKNFLGGKIFFDRDSGLTCRGFQSIGCDSRAISLGPAREGDLEELIRAPMEQLSSPNWWRQFELDGLILHSWGNPIYRPIVDAIRDAGIRLAQVTDTHGVVSPLADWRGHLKSTWIHHWHQSFTRKLVQTTAKLPYTHTVGLLRHDLPIVRMIDAGDYFLAATPVAAARFQRLAHHLGGKRVAEKVRMVPFPVNFHFRFDPEDVKHNEVIAVGRWDHPQKRQKLLMATIGHALCQRDDYVFRIFGGITTELAKWHTNLAVRQRGRVKLEGKVPNDEVAAAYRRARVMLVTAAYEGCHNASAEAVCSGCSVVSATNPFLCALDWHTSKSSGRTTTDDSPEGLSTALCAELSDWDAGCRDPHQISAEWIKIFYPDAVAHTILNLTTNNS